MTNRRSRWVKFGVSFFFSIFTVLLQTCLKFGILLLHNILLLKIKSFQSLMNILRFAATILFAPKCIRYLALKSHINGRWQMSSYILSSWYLHQSSAAPRVSCIITFITKLNYVFFRFDDIIMTKTILIAIPGQCSNSNLFTLDILY